jgi:microcystin-dependent protein
MLMISGNCIIICKNKWRNLMSLRTFDYASIVTLTIAIGGGIFYLGGLNTRITDINPKAIQAQVDEGIQQIKSAADSKINYVPVGSIVAFAGPKANIPKGWMLCNGAKIHKGKMGYEELRQAIGYTYGGSVQDEYLMLPNFNGLFLRGIDLTGNIDKGGTRKVGNIQRDSTSLPNHPFKTNKDGNQKHNYSSNDMAANRGGKDGYWYSSQTPRSPRTTGDASHIHTISVGGDEETRPVNGAIFWIIKITNSEPT